MPPPVHSARVIIVGDSGVGKSTILSTYNRERFNPVYVQTREREIKNATVQVNRRSVELQIWDTPGNPLHRTITAAYMKERIQGVVFVYDVTDDRTCYNVQHWLNTVNEYAGNDLGECKGNLKFVFVGNKADKTQERKVYPESGEQLAKQYNGFYVDASAKTSQNIDQIFQRMAESIFSEDKKQHNSPPRERDQDDDSGSLGREKKRGFGCVFL